MHDHQQWTAVYVGSLAARMTATDETCVYVARPYVWGEKCLEHQTLKKTLGETLFKQPTTQEVLDLLDKSLLQQSIVNFPLSRSLDVRFS